jgi:hypothetical protein
MLIYSEDNNIKTNGIAHDNNDNNIIGRKNNSR